MKPFKFGAFLLLLTVLFAFEQPVSAQLKIGYINSNQVLEKYKEAIDVRKQLADLNEQWKKDARGKEQEITKLTEELESQSLLLSDERKAQKQAEIQNLYTAYQQYLQEKWNPQNGEAVKKEVELIQPVYDKINVAIKKIGAAEGYSFIFDVVAGNILYASDEQPDLTERLIEELNKNLGAQAGN